ncbi:DUF3466 family protein [Photobacterium carnosum]|uniref:DUF3466 family protein n=1 Tax=Photobacterium carnosum TaxID=2023717 RepID=UPI001E3A314E|nr:DUF3466 family protein [Photobacterium carnosum]MCD9544224.1 DUF3466 family protein [Photobacterium carnosum]
MPHKMLKLSTLAILIAGASQASAAVYTVVPVDNGNKNISKVIKDLDYFSEAQANANEIPISVFSTGIKASVDGENCFIDKCVEVVNGQTVVLKNYGVTGAARRGTQGTPINDTVAYNQNDQHVNDFSELEQYCDANLNIGYCSNVQEGYMSWAGMQYFGDNYNPNASMSNEGVGGLQKKQAAWKNDYYSNSFALDDGKHITSFADLGKDNYSGSKKDKLGTIIDHPTTDAVANGIVGDYVYGTTTSALFKNTDGNMPRAFEKRGFVNTVSKKVELPPVSKGSDFVNNMGQTEANGAVVLTNGDLLVVGSSSYAPSFYFDGRDDDKLPDTDDIGIAAGGLDFGKLKQCITNPDVYYSRWECQFSTFANEAAYWLVNTDGTVTSHAISAGSGDNRDGLAVIDKDNDSLSFQASAQAVALDTNGEPIAVGYSTADVRDDYYAMQAAYFTAKSADLTSWTRTLIPGLDIKPGDDRDFTYTIANGVNSKSVIVGDAKGNSEKPQRAFVYKAGQSKAQFFDDLAPTIFFKDSNSNAAAINNNGQVVGWVDVEASNGAEARHRAFTYINSTAQGPLKTGGAWMLDDLTNDPSAGVGSLANSYRIHDATGINNAGVIAATASYCQDGYANLSKLAHCNSTEQQVIVKLVPNANATAADIHPRAKDEDQPLKRSGGSLGILALTALGFIGFRRRK